MRLFIRCLLLLVLIVLLGISFYPQQLGLSSEQTTVVLKCAATPLLVILAVVVVEPLAWRLVTGKKK